MKGEKLYSRLPVFIILFAVLLTSCKSEKIVSEVKLKPLGTEKIVRKIEENAFDYRYFSIRRINCQFEDGDNRTTFRANLTTQKDKSVVVSFNKLNIPVGRILLTPDSIKYVNHLEKTFFIGDYSFLRKMFNVNLDFNDVQAIIGNNLFSFGGETTVNDFKDFSSEIESGKYVIMSLKSRKSDKIREAEGRKTDRNLKKFNSESSVLQTITVDPGSFNIEKIRMENQSGDDWVEFDFREYTAFEKKDYPGSIDMDFHSAETNISMKLRLAGFSTEKPDDGGFKIPEKYDRIIIRQED